MEVTPAHRFAAFDREQSLPTTCPVRRAIRDARYWESFPESYSPAQVAAGRDLVLACGETGAAGSLAVERAAMHVMHVAVFASPLRSTR